MVTPDDTATDIDASRIDTDDLEAQLEALSADDSEAYIESEIYPGITVTGDWDDLADSALLPVTVTADGQYFPPEGPDPLGLLDDNGDLDEIVAALDVVFYDFLGISEYDDRGNQAHYEESERYANGSIAFTGTIESPYVSFEDEHAVW